MKNNSVLVTGGAGFIGSHLADRLLAEGNDVFVLDNFDPYYDLSLKQKNIEHNMGKESYTLIEGDIRDYELLKSIITNNDIEYIFHNAAQAGVRISLKDPFKTHEVNATGTLNILEAARGSHVKKFINASSSSVYGKVSRLPFEENHPHQPISPYGASKLLAEHYCRIYYEIYGLKSVSLRYFTVFGPRMRPDLAINIFTHKALNNEPIEIFGDGEKTRDFTYIDNVVEANILGMKKGKGEYNIGGGVRCSIIDLARKIISITGSSSEIIHSENVKGDAEHTMAHIGKAKKEIGYSPAITFENGIRYYINWIKSSMVG